MKHIPAHVANISLYHDPVPYATQPSNFCSLTEPQFPLQASEPTAPFRLEHVSSHAILYWAIPDTGT